MKQLYTTQEIAKMLKVSEKTVFNFRQEGMPFKEVGRSIRFDADEVSSWLVGEEKNDFTLETLKSISNFLSGGPEPQLEEDLNYIINEMERLKE